ncbi:lysozyme [Clostridium butyricum]|uniref:lysozyme n=1 Tax=Clostridium butyricum TaxID=1492 RepID=UPI00090BA8DB|nr:lysozyme [Clostridium butyricum]APF21084.1 phage lysozyme family protein [Clostridium butyricum]
MLELSKIDWKKTNDNKWIAYDENGNQITGWLHDTTRDTWYFCYSDDIATGWMKDNDGRWYYFFSEQCIDYNNQMYRGEMKVGWLKESNKWYYLLPWTNSNMGLYKGQMIFDTTEEIDNVEYSFNKDGSLIENIGISDRSTEFIASWEGFYPKAYADPYYGASVQSYWTIGYGTCYCIHPEAFQNGLNSTITKEYALELLKDEANKCYEKIVSNLQSRGIALNEDKLSSLTSFSYNCGTSALFGSTLYKNICAGITDENTIKNNFTAWSKANGQTSEGLYRRRVKEANIFLYGIYENN